MQSERSTTEIHPLLPSTPLVIYYTIVITHVNYSHIFHNAGVTRLYCYFLIAHQTCFRRHGEAGFRMQDLSHAKRTLYH